MLVTPTARADYIVDCLHRMRRELRDPTKDARVSVHNQMRQLYPLVTELRDFLGAKAQEEVAAAASEIKDGEVRSVLERRDFDRSRIERMLANWRGQLEGLERLEDRLDEYRQEAARATTQLESRVVKVEERFGGITIAGMRTEAPAEAAAEVAAVRGSFVYLVSYGPVGLPDKANGWPIFEPAAYKALASAEAAAFECRNRLPGVFQQVDPQDLRFILQWNGASSSVWVERKVLR